MIKQIIFVLICVVCLTSLIGFSEDNDESSVKLTIDDALLTARKYMGENRIYAGNFMITSATLHDEMKDEKHHWEIVLRKKREGSQVNRIILRVYMDKTVDRVETKTVLESLITTTSNKVSEVKSEPKKDGGN